MLALLWQYRERIWLNDHSPGRTVGVATVTHPGPFATKPTEQLIEAADTTRLHRAVGALDLTALGIGAIIGTGIFVIIGEAITDSGPAIVIAFVLAGVTCAFSALSYAELASSLPMSGSA